MWVCGSVRERENPETGLENWPNQSCLLEEASGGLAWTLQGLNEKEIWE